MRTGGLILLFFLSFFTVQAQNERKLNREGVLEYKDGKFDDAELYFRKAKEADSTMTEAMYNIANTLYKQEKYEEAGKLFEELINNPEEKYALADIHHNLGNSFLKKEQYQQSIEAYKNALRIRPDDEDTRYNLAYAQAKLQQNQQNQDQQNQDQQNQDQQNQDQQNQDQQNQDQQNQDQQNQDQQEQNKQEQEKEQEQEKQEQQMNQSMKALSKEDMERLLQAIQQQEKMVQAKLEREKAKAPKVSTDKDW